MEVTLVGARLPGGKRDVRFFVPPSSPEETFSQLLGRIRELVQKDPVLQKLGLSPQDLEEYRLVTGKSGGYYPLNEKWAPFQTGSRLKLRVERTPVERPVDFPDLPPIPAPTPSLHFLTPAEGVGVEKELGISVNGAKNELQKLFQSRMGPRALPQYRQLPIRSSTGHFFVAVELTALVGVKTEGYGRAPTKKEAEKLAALDGYRKCRDQLPEEPEPEENPTSVLNETFHRIFGRSPTFVYSEAPGGYRVQLEVNGRTLEAVGPNKSKAARLVSQKALTLLRNPTTRPVQSSSFTTLILGKKEEI